MLVLPKKQYINKVNSFQQQQKNSKDGWWGEVADSIKLTVVTINIRIDSMKKTVPNTFCLTQPDWFYEEDSVGYFLLDPGLILGKKTVLDIFCLIQDWFYEEDSVGYFLLDQYSIWLQFAACQSVKFLQSC